MLDSENARGDHSTKFNLLYKAQFVCVCVCVCLFVIQIHSSQPISTKLGMKHPWGQGQSKVRLPMHSVELCSRRGTRKK